MTAAAPSRAGAAAPAPMVPEVARVLRVARETEDTFTLRLETARPFRFEPGQFNMLYVPGAGEVPISISGDADEPEPLVHTIRAVGGVTQALERLRRGDTLGVRGPFGTAWPLEQARGRDVLVMAGGLGLAPLRPAVLRILARRKEIRRLELIYGARTPETILFPRDLEAWRGRFDTNVHVTVDRAGPEWRGRIGVVTSVLPRARFEPAETLALVCGPEVMMRFCARELEGRGVPASRIFLSLERNMRCGVGHCGHCQLGPLFLCRDGPVVPLDRVASLMSGREV